MSGTAVIPEGLYTHPSFSPAVRASGETIYVAGQLALSPAGEIVGPDDIDVQLERIWFQIESILAAAGASLADVVRVTAYTTDVAFVQAIVAARQARFAGLTPPASALVVVAGLALPGSVVEIDAVAVL
ncbi:RidA family protein [Cryobacterium sp. SO2]|uniref:RidA family protein n=1 Tax=Cryobacterium sp. SO2 TaxID=1897060 RepID=UPI00223CE23B|nr:RidA family protein [Cryobacterium sp. SO2]WEO77857.1 RidA family protein [Cryobacterium sp. SO2]